MSLQNRSTSSVEPSAQLLASSTSARDLTVREHPHGETGVVSRAAPPPSTISACEHGELNQGALDLERLRQDHKNRRLALKMQRRRERMGAGASSNYTADAT